MSGLHPPGLTTQMPVGQMPVGEQQTVDQNARQIHKDGSSWMCGQHNVRATAGDNIGQNKDKWNTPSPRLEIKISDPAGNRTPTAGLKGRDSSDHATATG